MVVDEGFFDLDVSIAIGVAHQEELCFSPQLMFVWVDQLSHVQVEFLADYLVFLHSFFELLLEGSLGVEVARVGIVGVDPFHYGFLDNWIVAQEERNEVGEVVHLVFLEELLQVHFPFDQVLLRVQEELLSHHIADQINCSTHFFLKILNVVVDYVQIWVINPLLHCPLIQVLGLLQSLIPRRIGLRTVVFLRPSRCSDHVNHHVISVVADEIPGPPGFFEDFVCQFGLAVGEVVADSSVIENEDVFFLQLGQGDVVVFHVYLLLANGSGHDQMLFVGIVLGNDVDPRLYC